MFVYLDKPPPSPHPTHMYCILPPPTPLLLPGRLKEATETVEKEITLEYCRVMNQFILDKAVKDDPATFAFVTLPIKLEKPAPRFGESWELKPMYGVLESLLKSFTSLGNHGQCLMTQTDRSGGDTRFKVDLLSWSYH